MAGGTNPFVYSYNNPINLFDPLGLYAQFGHRPLNAIGFIPWGGNDAWDDTHNMAWLHEQLWFGDYMQNPDLPTNSGFFGANGMWNKPGRVTYEDNHRVRDYTFFGPLYDDAIMREALRNVETLWNGTNYNVLTENCQDFADALRDEYHRLGGKAIWPGPVRP